jgi:hypothetical protein
VPAQTPLPALPHWEQTPDDLPDATRQIKAALRARLAAGTRCTRTGSAAARPAPTPLASAPISTPARSTCG